MHSAGKDLFKTKTFLKNHTSDCTVGKERSAVLMCPKLENQPLVCNQIHELFEVEQTSVLKGSALIMIIF